MGLREVKIEGLSPAEILNIIAIFGPKYPPYTPKHTESTYSWIVDGTVLIFCQANNNGN